jgi:hypothetical protein
MSVNGCNEMEQKTKCVFWKYLILIEKVYCYTEVPLNWSLKESLNIDENSENLNCNPNEKKFAITLVSY